MMLNIDFVIRLLVAGILGAIIGLDREYRAKEAGYRTHFLVSLGSALIMIVSQYGFQVFLNFYSDYYILELDEENYNYALVGSSTDKYLWILSRTPQLPEEIKKKLVTAAERRGYDTNRLQWIEQF